MNNESIDYSIIMTRFIKYLIIVSVACIVDFLVFNITYDLTNKLSFSNLIAFIFGNIIACILLQLFVFKIKVISQIKQFYFSIFLSIMVFIICTFSLIIIVNILDLGALFAKIITLGLSFTLNYSTRNYFFLKFNQRKIK